MDAALVAVALVGALLLVGLNAARSRSQQAAVAGAAASSLPPTVRVPLHATPLWHVVAGVLAGAVNPDWLGRLVSPLVWGVSWCSMLVLIAGLRRVRFGFARDLEADDGRIPLGTIFVGAASTALMVSAVTGGITWVCSSGALWSSTASRSVAFLSVAVVSLYFSRRLGWAVSPWLYTTAGPIALLGCAAWGIACAAGVHELVLSLRPWGAVRWVGGYLLGAYVAVPDFGLFGRRPQSERATMIASLPLAVYAMSLIGSAVAGR